jgi:hypothetical protein
MARPKEEGITWEFCADLEEVQLARAHARHALADGRLDGGARNFSVFEYAPLGAAKYGSWRQLLLELPLLAWCGRQQRPGEKKNEDKVTLTKTISAGP